MWPAASINRAPGLMSSVRTAPRHAARTQTGASRENKFTGHAGTDGEPLTFNSDAHEQFAPEHWFPRREISAGKNTGPGSSRPQLLKSAGIAQCHFQYNHRTGRAEYAAAQQRP